jgi:DNA-binding CsgD family transcriptional regulator/tetratricopeptide (TPR) repeat protein
LEETDFEVLGAAAAAGPTAPEVLADVCDRDTGALEPTLGRLFAAALLVGDGDEVRFRHELAREVFYDELLPGRRAGLHARLAESVRVHRPDRLGEIARHWSAANDPRRALPASVAAGRQALRTGAAAEAEGHLARALELWDSVDDAATLTGLDHPGLLVEAAIAAEHARHLDAAIELARQAAAQLANVDATREGEAWLLLRNLYRFTYRWVECADAVAHALAVIPESPPSRARAEALAAAALGERYANRPDEAMTHARHAVAVADAVGEPDIFVVAHNALAVAFFCAGDYEGALVVSMDSLEHCGPGVSPESVLMAYNEVINGLAMLGRQRELPAYAERGMALARRTGLGGPRTAWLAYPWIGSLVLLGRWDEAEHVIGEVADLLDDPTQKGERAVNWARVLIRQGRVDEAGPMIEEGRGVLFDSHWDQGRGDLAAAIVEFDAAEGRCADVQALVSACLGQDQQSAESDMYLVAAGIAALADCAHIGVPAVNQRVAIEEAVATATRWIEQTDADQRDGRQPTFWQELDRGHAIAQLERLQGRSDPQQWARRATGWAELGFRYDEAVARYHHADALLAGPAGRTSASRAAAANELTAARGIAAELHAEPLMAKIDDLAGRARLVTEATSPPDPQPRGGAPPDPFGLTPRELNVLALLARGKTNGQIGKDLYISTKTASTHVSNIIRKLGVTNRVEAATLATRHGRRPP